MTQTDKKRTAGTIVAIALLTMVLLCAMATPAAAETRKYAEKTVIIYDYSKPAWSPDRYHFGLVYGVPLQANRNACIGGVDQTTLNRYAPEHSNVQRWDRKSYGSGKSVLLIPKRYVLHRWNYASEIYLAFPSGRV